MTQQSAPQDRMPSEQEIRQYLLGIFSQKFSGLLEEMKALAPHTPPNFAPSFINNLHGRFELALSYFTPKLIDIFKWLTHSTEVANFTYSISEGNRNYLAAFCSVVTESPIVTIEGYINEICSDFVLKDYIRALIPALEHRNIPLDSNFDFGRRIGWYVIARAIKPKVIVETGVAQGIGSLVLTSALMKNTLEGHAGVYYGTDIDPSAGLLFGGAYQKYGQILYGDSIESLKKMQQPIDLFINDSDHSAEYEMREYQTIVGMLSPNAVILGDNSHVTDKLCTYARQINKRYLFFKEQPANHWYPGAGIGVAF